MELVGLTGTAIGLSSIAIEFMKKWRKEALGLLTLYEPSQPKVDIVFVHGLQGHATRTWTTSEVCWPIDLLPHDAPNARILTFGYGALVGEATPLSIKDLGKTLLDSLSINRRHTKAATRPLIFVAHSLGGIVVKSALVYSRALGTVDWDSYQISKATRACVFFGTPHVKSGKASWAQMQSYMSRTLAAHSPLSSRILGSLLASAEDMLRLSSDFCHQSGHIQLISCFETMATSTYRGKVMVVPKENASMGTPNERVIAINADHIEMTKFLNKSDPTYHWIIQQILDARSYISDHSAHTATHKANKERPATIEGEDITRGEDGADPVERERRFLSNIRSDWLDDVMIEDNSPGTCEWVLSSHLFRAWLSGSTKVLWIQGRAGAGKTVLAKFLYRQLCDVFAGDAVSSGAHRPQWFPSASKYPPRPRQVLAYFLDVNSPLRNSGLSVLHSLLYQILSTDQRLFRYVHGKPIFSRPRRGDFGQYAEVLSAILRDPSLKGTIIVLDALDECGPTSQLKIIDMLSALADQSSIQLLVTSRLTEKLKPEIKLDLSESKEHVETDIKIYVETAVGELAALREFPKYLTDVIKREVLAASPQDFLWVQLVLQSISKAKTARGVRQRLKKLPRDLCSAYSDSLNGTTGSTNEHMRRTLYFVMIAEVPLQVKDLSALLALSHCWDYPDASTDEMIERPPESNVTRITLNLNEITENRTINFEEGFRKYSQPLLRLNENTVRLVHQSVRQFLEMPNEISKFHATFHLQLSEDGYERDLRDLCDVHGTMAALCLQYILAAFQEHDHDDPLNFLAFACLHWTTHARKAGKSRSFRLKRLVKLLFSEEMDYASSWLSTIADGQAARVALLPLKADIAFILAAFDLGSCFGTMLGVSIESLLCTDQEQRTPLHLAAANNSSMSVQWIQDIISAAGMELGDLATRKDSKGESPISLAAQNGHEGIMRKLLVSTKPKYEFDSRLFRAIADSGSRVMFERLYNYTNIKTPDQGMSLLTDAAAFNSVDLMQRISFDHGGLKTMQDAFAARPGFNGDPLLHVALRKKADQVFKYVLDSGYSLAATDTYGNTALHVAVQEGNEQAATELISKGASVNPINEGRETPLHIASRIGLPIIVRLLCKYGANVNLAGPSGCLPAHLAAETGQQELIYTLLQFGTNVEATDDIGRSALHVAAEAGQGSPIAALLLNGADVNARDDEGRTPAHYAVQSGDLSILYMLCEAGADLSASEYSSITPLHLAAQRGSEILVRELVHLGTDPNSRDSDSRTPLHYSCLSKRSRAAVVRTLLDAGADVNALDHQGLSPLHHACLSESVKEADVRYLLEHGADVNALDHHGLSPLHHACLSESAKEADVRYLLEKGANFNEQNEDGDLPLQYAMKRGNSGIIRLLHKFGATVSAHG